MTLKDRRIFLLITLFLCLITVSVSHSATVPERPPQYVVDLAGIVDDATENRLNGYLQLLLLSFVVYRQQQSSVTIIYLF